MIALLYAYRKNVTADLTLKLVQPIHRRTFRLSPVFSPVFPVFVCPRFLSDEPMPPYSVAPPREFIFSAAVLSKEAKSSSDLRSREFYPKESCLTQGSQLRAD